MIFFKLFVRIIFIFFFAVTSTFAIDIEPDHGAIVKEAEIPVLSNKKHVPIQSKDMIEDVEQRVEKQSQDVGVPIAPIEPSSSHNSQVIAPQAIDPTVTQAIKKDVVPVSMTQVVANPQPVAPSVISSPTSSERIYYARSVTSNNPEYKTRFSIIHETPSPKRIAGERLYNVSDAFFRLAVNGNQIKILDNPVLTLSGINSASGRYGEIRVLDGAILNVHGSSNRFKGSWDLDGTGERALKITPTNLVSGTIPVHVKTFKADGSVMTDEHHELTFKAMAMGPYNGYWSDGQNIGLFLWGMSRAKLQSREMSYIGLDLGIVTQAAPEATGAIGGGEVIPSAIVQPIAPAIIGGGNQSTGSVAPLGGGNYSSAPFLGGFAGGGIGGGSFIGGGGGGSTTNIDQGDKITNVTENNTIIIKDLDAFCRKNPKAKICSINNPCTNDPTCQPCVDFCKANPTSPTCCSLNPGQCNPNDPCLENPTLPQCKPDTPVSEPFAPLALLSAVALFIGLRRSRNVAS